MITCSVCGKENDDLAITCTSCKGYLQSKVENLDLFSSLWGLTESPRIAFKRIVLARRKNYVLLLGALLGIALVYGGIAVLNLGRLFGTSMEGFATVLWVGLVGGPLFGFLLIVLSAWVVWRIAVAAGGRGTIRNTLAVLVYGAFPVVVALAFVFPVQLAIFGQYLFDHNPSPFVIKPALFLLLVGFDCLAVLWSWMLFAQGICVAHGVSRARAFIATLGVPALLGTIAAVTVLLTH